MQHPEPARDGKMIQFTSYPRDEFPPPRPRCRVCHRRLRSQPWSTLMIGPICARKQPALLAMIRNEFAQADKAPEFAKLLENTGLAVS